MIGQHAVYNEAGALINQLLGLDVNTVQIQRVCGYYRKQIDPIVNADHHQYIPQLEESTKDEYTYVMVDSSMLMTREDKLKESKLGGKPKGYLSIQDL